MLAPAFAFFCTVFSFSSFALEENQITYYKKPSIEIIINALGIENYDALKRKLERTKIKRLLQNTVAMNPDLIQKVITTLKCAQKSELEHKPTLTVIDFSLPANQKRLWVFDLKEKQLLFHTHVSHGIKSGALLSEYFSNVHNSKTSSIGVFKTGNAYYGRYGLALKLDGLERTFNDHAFGRAIVMHGGWYVNEEFINKYGRPGRSWGCPAIPMDKKKPIIDTIKDQGLFVAYYPSENWYIESNYLNCEKICLKPQATILQTSLTKPEENRDAILFIEKNNNNSREQDEPIIAMPAESYQRIFSTRAPLKRMLRRQIQNQEYIALNHDELDRIVSSNPEHMQEVFFIIQQVKQKRGYWATEMKKVDLGPIDNVIASPSAQESNSKGFIVHFKHRSPIHLKSTDQFIRWLGL